MMSSLEPPNVKSTLFTSNKKMPPKKLEKDKNYLSNTTKFWNLKLWSKKKNRMSKLE